MVYTKIISVVTLAIIVGNHVENTNAGQYNIMYYMYSYAQYSQL